MTPQLLSRLPLAALWAVSLCGCAMPSWDDLTSRELGVKALWTKQPPPMTVIEKSTDGYARGKAITQLDEPNDKAELEKRLQVLQQVAMTDRDPYCRLTAITTLGRYHDSRAGKILVDVHLGNPGLSPENNAQIKKQALIAPQTHAPSDSRQLFITAAMQPGGSLTGTAQRDRMEILDERLGAIRALAKYPQKDAVDTLVKLLENEKDTAIRKCAHEALVESQKQDIPADGKAWRAYVVSGTVPPPQNNNFLTKMFKTDPTPATTTNGPGFFDKITNMVRPEPEPTPPVVSPRTGPPTTLPTTLPSTPLNQTSNPYNRNVTPAGATRQNAQGELIVPASPP